MVETQPSLGSIAAQAIRERTMRAIRGGLVDTIIPALPSGDPTTVSHLVLRLIDHLIALEKEVEVPTERLTAIEQEAIAEAIRGDDNARRHLKQLAEAESERLIRMDPEAAGGVAQMYLGGRTSRADSSTQVVDETPELTEERLTAYMRRRFPARSDITIRKLETLSGGMSKQTIKVEAEDGGTRTRFVIRKDFPILATGASVVEEFPMLKGLWAAGGLPMPEPLWDEPDPAIFGTPLMAVSLVEGSNDYSAALGDPAQGKVFAEALAKAMARLHSMPLQQTIAGPVVERAPREHVAAEIERWHVGLRRWKVAPEPVLESVFAWLHANIPDQVAPSAIVHGDIGFHNMLMKDGQLAALLDWEFTHIGDPAEDVVYSRFFVEQVIDWPSFIALYVKHGGTAPSPQQEQFYAVWQSARNAAGCAGAERAFFTREAADMKFGVSGMTFKPRFALDALQKIALGSAYP